METIVTRHEPWVDPALMQPMSKVSTLIVILGIVLIPISTPLSLTLLCLSMLLSGYAMAVPEVVRYFQRRALSRAIRDKTILHLTPQRKSPVEDQWIASRLVSMVRTRTLWSLFQPKPEVIDWCTANLTGRYGVVPMDFMDVIELRGVRMWFDRPDDAERFRLRWLRPEDMVIPWE